MTMRMAMAMKPASGKVAGRLHLIDVQSRAQCAWLFAEAVA